MKHLVITETKQIPFSIESKIAIMPQTFIIHADINNEGVITILFSEDTFEKDEIHSLMLLPPEEYKHAFKDLSFEEIEELGRSLTASISFDISYFIANGKYYFDDESEFVENQPGVFDINVKVEEWYTDIVYEMITNKRQPTKDKKDSSN